MPRLSYLTTKQFNRDSALSPKTSRFRVFMLYTIHISEFTVLVDSLMSSLPFPISPFSSHKKLTLMSSSNPTIVLVHGGMHDDSYLAPLIASLNARFYPTVSGLLPTVSSATPKSVELSTDVDHIRSILIKNPC